MNKTCLAILLAAGLGWHGLSAATVTARLSADEASVGTPVEMQVRVDGTTNVSLPRDLGVDGLQSQLTGRSTQVSIINGRMTTSGLYSYTIIPQREGTFEIPALEINADGQRLRTAAQRLTVRGGAVPRPRSPAPSAPMAPGTGTSRSPRSAPPTDDAQLAYAEMLVPRKSVYVGEVIPVELRFYFNDQVGFQILQDQPQIGGEGFTVQKFSPAQQTEEVIGDQSYHVLTFKTAITAVKSGPMEVPTASLVTVARVPSRGPRGMDSLFDQFFGGQGMPGFTENREVKVETKPIPIRVKALPTEGRPANFSGAVGDFTIAASAEPTKAAAGDPVTLQVAVSGRGNFDAMGEPTLVKADGWRAYPPTDRFEKSDVIGFTGTKTFEMPMVAQRAQTETPVAEFSYFDPVKEKYFTISSQPVVVTAEATAANEPAAEAGATPTATPSATPAQPSGDGWLASATPRSWEALAKRPSFLAANAFAALALVGLVAALAARTARRGPAGQRAAVIRRRNQLIAEMGRNGSDDAEFFAKAFEVLTVQASLAGESGPFEFVRSLEANGRDTTELRTVLGRADEIKFGGGAGARPTDAAERQRITAALREVSR